MWGTWPVDERFEIERGKDISGNEEVFLYAPSRPLPVDPRRLYRDFDAERDEGFTRLYTPLRDAPDLFLRFATLARAGSFPEDNAIQVMRKWVTTYGVLGLDDIDCLEIEGRSFYRKGRRESLSAFVGAAREAARCLELYEAATAPSGPDTEVLDKYPTSQDLLRQKREWALTLVLTTVSTRVRADCHPVLYGERTARRERAGEAVGLYEQETTGFDWGWGFDSLLGAMYLQMMLYMKGGGEGRRCKRPGCYRIITFDLPRPAVDAGPKKGVRGEYRTRTDKDFCGKACAQWWSDNFGNSKKARAKQQRQRRNAT